ncbi:hypothetical protein [Methanoregula sp.]|uniref:hypothetical protein n=1 Tax=Methanoregula sp. TaxID=2052170 RepID=UPI003568E5B4
MKIPHLNPYYRAALILIAAACVLIAIAVLTNRRDITTAAVVISGVICLLTGIFLATLSRSEPLDTRYVSLLSVQGSINLSRVCADLGIQGNATIIPKGRDGRSETVQFVPVAEFKGAPSTAGSFVTGADTAGLQIIPSGDPLFREIRDLEQMIIPEDMPAIKDLIREVAVEVLEIAERVEVTDDGDIVSVTMKNYRLINGCREISRESPRCCTAVPCPVCSLFACILAEGSGKVVQLEHCSAEPATGSVKAVFTLLP